ncbi:uroporphyrinogen-III synthase [Acetobacteraceae bacterium ESL0709]|nr:uroporphyrinogen-III synthase [Acetobacteraceae bacterium ESL0697]MDF7677806.1 uroporphyrinogen-III synthase [Acetobacteraceae bacterium ESL0709]
MGDRHIVLVTRPEPGLSEALNELKKRGWQGMACPALEIKPSEPFPPLDCKAFLVTSGQALSALARQKRDKLLVVVGEKTASRARESGFVNILVASGNAASLETLCLARGLTGPDVVLACGQGMRGQDYGESLRVSLSVRSLYAYKVLRPEHLPPDALEAIEKEQTDSILFYSGETVVSFGVLCPLTTARHLKTVRAICYSESIAKRASALGVWSSVEVGAYPPVCLI